MISNLLTFHISSADRDDGTIEDFLIDLNIDQSLRKQLNKVALSSIVIPKTYYNIQENSYFYLYEDDVLITININPGNYNKNQLSKVLSSKLTSQSLNQVVYLFQQNNTEYDDGLIKITCDKPLINKKIYFVENEVYDCLGFFKEKYYQFTNELIGEKIQNLNSNNIIYLHSNIICSPMNDFKTSGNNILTYINNCGACPFYSFIQKDYSDLLFHMKDLIFNPLMRFYLTSENRNINLHNINYNFSIHLFTYQENAPLYKKINNFMNYTLVNEEEK